jgi:pimeloyl-ACP methyl ester carboxylesterase
MSAHAPLYLIPGTMCDARLWERMLPFMNGAEITHADYSGSETMEAMLARVMDGAPNAPCHLVGFSLGGYLAMMAATRAPERFKSLTVIAASPYGLSDDEKALRQRNAEMLTRLTYRGMSKVRLKQFVAENHLDNEAITGTILAMEHDLGQAELIRQLIAPIERPNVKAELLALDLPVHFIMAKDDAMVPFGAIEKLASGSNGKIELHAIEGSGHMIPLEAPKQLAERLQAICC